MTTTNKPMNTDAQKTAIAVACGWKHIDNDPKRYPYWLAPKGDSRYGNPLDANLFPKAFPDYLTDLNAMHEAEYHPSIACNYPRYVAEIAKLLPASDSDTAQFADLAVCHATAAQRAEAFLRTIGKWEDAK